MTSRNGGPAYPVEENYKSSQIGITVVDYIASMIIAGIYQGMTSRGVPITDFEDAAIFHGYQGATKALGVRKMYE